jgi:enoyl-CoA hydratase
MPETGIGLFPDVGATRFLNRCPGYIGRYLGLTGARLNAEDTLYCGFATHAVKHDRVEALVEELGRASRHTGYEYGLDEVYLGRFAVKLGPGTLAALQPAIDRCFAGDSVETILDALAGKAAGGPQAAWAEGTRARLLTKSPTSLKITLRQLTIGRDYGLEAALALEYRLTQHVMAAHDFYEGVRAMLIDRDQKPHWRPATLAEVSKSMVDAYFASIDDLELRFP